MMSVDKMMFVSFLCLASWQDARTRQISVWVYCIFAGFAAFSLVCKTGQADPLEMICGAGIGAALLGISHMTRGAVGAGDGWFFLVAGMFLGFWRTLALLCYGLLFCSAFCLLIAVWGWRKRISVKKYKVPFLPFVLPAGIWLVLL